MMKKIALFIFSVILGCCIGILLPVRPTVLGEETPLFSSWSTIFDWILRFLEPLGVFATIIVAVEEGRKIYDNVCKVIQFQLSTNLSEVIIMFVASLLNFTGATLNSMDSVSDRDYLIEFLSALSIISIRASI